METNYTTDTLFLEPPHSHDPSNVSHVAALPTSMLSQLPLAVQDALWTLQESTSVVYASYLRLQALLDERFERLTPLPGLPGSYSETSFFNYMNALRAERSYLLNDAHPDWKHKARLANILPYNSISLMHRGKTITISQWMDQLRNAENLWIQNARDAEVPGFEETVLEYQSLSEGESESDGSVVSTPGEDEGWNFPVSVARKVHQSDLGPKRIAKALEAL